MGKELPTTQEPQVKRKSLEMKVSKVKIKEFKRFTELEIVDLPASARLVMLAGPNGSGKSSLYDAFQVWFRGNSTMGQTWDVSYHERNNSAAMAWNQRVSLEFHTSLPSDPNLRRKLFYFRTAYRNDPDFTLNNLTTMPPVIAESRFSRMIESDIAVSANYRRLASQALADVFELADESTTIRAFRESVIGELRDAIRRLFPDLILNSLGNPLTRGTFYFDKGQAKQFLYKNLSGGEKAAFDLILDLVVKHREFDDTVYCIDEPEAHMNTRLQGQLLEELLRLIPENSQLWLATHSIGMMRRARQLEARQPGMVVFLDFSERDFDAPTTIAPTRPTRAFWERALGVALDDLAALVAPREVVVCEGNPAGAIAGQNAQFDADCYNIIFADEFPETKFVSGGNSHDVASDRQGFVTALPALARGITVIRLIDRDDRGPGEVQESSSRGVRVLSRRHLESYLFDDEVLRALCISLGRESDLPGVLSDKQAALASSQRRGNPSDDLKSASGEFYNMLKRRLSLTARGDNVRAFALSTLVPLLRPGLTTYEELKGSIFPSIQTSA